MDSNQGLASINKAAVSLTASVLLMFAAVCAVLYPTRETILRAKGFTVDADEYDFGVVSAGQILTHTFTIRNNDSNPVRLLGVKLGCAACIHITDLTKEIAGRAAGHITVQYTPSEEPGPHTYSVRVRTDNPQSPGFVLRVSAVTRGVVVIPEVVDFGNLSGSETRTASAVVRAYGSGHYDISTIDCDEPALHIACGAARMRDDGKMQRIWELPVRVWIDPGKLEIGRLRTDVLLGIVNNLGKTLSPVHLRVLAYRSGPVSIDPVQVFFGLVPADREVVRTCELRLGRYKDKKNANLTIRCNSEHLSGSVVKQEGAGASTWVLKLRLKAGPHDTRRVLRGTVAVVDSLSGDTIVTVPWLAYRQQQVDVGDHTH